MQYKKQRLRKQLFLWLLLLLLAVVAGIALVAGSLHVGWREVFGIWQGGGEELTRQIILQIRLPRIFGAVMAGMVLALSGAGMQILLRNPLASPYTLGISNAAAFGAAFSIVVLSVQVGHHLHWVTLSALGGSLVGLLSILLLIKIKRATVETIILSGVMINSLFGAGIAVMQYLADQVELGTIVFWSFGDLGRSNWKQLPLLLLLLIPSLLYFYKKRWDYKALASGDDYARSLGIAPRRIRVEGLVVSALGTAVVVSFFGVIAFVGLVVPHLVRLCIGSDEEFVLPASALFGGVFLLLCDTLARTLFSPIILPVGIVTSLIGVPLFLFLLVRHKW